MRQLIVQILLYTTRVKTQARGALKSVSLKTLVIFNKITYKIVPIDDYLITLSLSLSISSERNIKYSTDNK
jgi:hypothetical protein